MAARRVGRVPEGAEWRLAVRGGPPDEPHRPDIDAGSTELALDLGGGRERVALERRLEARKLQAVLRPGEHRHRHDAPALHDLNEAVRRDVGRQAVDIDLAAHLDRKSTRLNSSHGYISYAVFCLKKKKKKN